MQRISWLDDLKIRASWGQLGNQNVGLYPFQEVLPPPHIHSTQLNPGHI
jgi:hypothetical protein